MFCTIARTAQFGVAAQVGWAGDEDAPDFTYTAGNEIGVRETPNADGEVQTLGDEIQVALTQKQFNANPWVGIEKTRCNGRHMPTSKHRRRGNAQKAAQGSARLFDGLTQRLCIIG